MEPSTSIQSRYKFEVLKCREIVAPKAHFWPQSIKNKIIKTLYYIHPAIIDHHLSFVGSQRTGPHSR